MKRNILLILFWFFLFPITGSSQDGYEKGVIITLDGEKHEGLIKKSFKRTGKLQFISSDNMRKKYVPFSLKGFCIGGIDYIAYEYDFYEQIFADERVKLYRKVTSNRNEIIYNGAEIIGFVKTTEGRIGDYYVRSGPDMKLELINKNNLKKYFRSDALSLRIKD